MLSLSSFGSIQAHSLNVFKPTKCFPASYGILLEAKWRLMTFCFSQMQTKF